MSEKYFRVRKRRGDGQSRATASQHARISVMRTPKVATMYVSSSWERQRGRTVSSNRRGGMIGVRNSPVLDRTWLRPPVRSDGLQRMIDVLWLF